MPEITQISSVQQITPATYDDILALRTRIDIALFNLTMGNGILGGADYKENGEVGFEVKKGSLLQTLTEWRKQLTADLQDPALLGEVVYEVSTGLDGVCRQYAKLLCPAPPCVPH